MKHCLPRHGRVTEQSVGGGVGPSIEEAEMIRTTTILALLAALAACETVEGFGEDVEAGGEAIQQSADEVQEGR
jgi:entericidin B